MSSPVTHPDMASPRMSAPPAADEGDGSDADIPKRMMRVKVLYTFDDSNKTNCLARLPNALPIPVIPLDESTQIGVVELKICIQAIVASSPELLAKLEHDYTVYAYDYSEYETPIVGQGMLSWVLASASPTPAAPASQSKTMITGRVCKNILGLFSSNGIKETLEVKLKLVPVPSCSKNEFLQNMAIYRNPNVVMPEGFDNNAWNSFLQAIPNAGSIEEQPQPQAMSQGGQSNNRQGMGGMEHLHDMLTPNFGPDDDNFSTHHSVHGSRTGSPTPSTLSASHQQTAAGYSQSRPESRMSMHQQNEYALDDQNFDDGPARKRARLTQADWNGRGSFGATADSLRVAVSTSASLRGFRPSAVGNTSAGNDMLPRAPTPRPSEKQKGRGNRPAMTSNLRRESSTSSYAAPYPPSDTGYSRMDSGIYSLGDDEASDRYGSPSPDIPSSPPEYTPVDGSLPPSSPGLPELPYTNDSGFQSDAVPDQPSYGPSNIHLARQKRGEIEWLQVQPGPPAKLPTQSFAAFDPISHKRSRAAVIRSSPTKKPYKRGSRAQSRVIAAPSAPNAGTPGAMEAPSPGVLPSVEGQTSAHVPTLNGTTFDDTQRSRSFPYSQQAPSAEPGQAMSPPESHPAFDSQSTAMQALSPVESQPTLGARPSLAPRESSQTLPTQGPASSSIVLPPKAKPSSRQGQWRNHGQNAPMSARSQSMAAPGSSDVESDGGNILGSDAPKKARRRNGSSMIRVNSINNSLEQSVAAGLPVKHCRNCGEIKTPTWRPYWARVHQGNGEDLDEVTSKIGIHMIEPINKDGEGKTLSYRVYKQWSHLTDEEKAQGFYEQFTFCNPCGDWVRKYGKNRPAEYWDTSLENYVKKKAPPRKPKRQRTRPGDLTSDLPAPSSEWDLQPSAALPQFTDPPPFTDPFMPSEGPTQSEPPRPPTPQQQARYAPLQPRSGNIQTSHLSRPSKTSPPNAKGEWDETAAMVALQQAIQSSPARALGSAVTPIEILDDISPRPTRRMLFPSPRKEGEFKSLDERGDPKSCTSTPSAQRTQTADAATAQSAPNYHKQSKDQSEEETEQVDKENLPPVEDDEDFGHLFDDSIMDTPGKVTPNTARTIANLLRTPTPLRPTRYSLTPRGTKRAGEHLTSPTPPSRTKLAPVEDRLKPMTPFTGALNQFFSDGFTSSPSRTFNWAHTSSPRGTNGAFGGFSSEDMEILNSDFPGMPSSPPLLGNSLAELKGMGFEFFEDATATEGLSGGWDAEFFSIEDGHEKNTGTSVGGERRASGDAYSLDFVAALEVSASTTAATAAS